MSARQQHVPRRGLRPQGASTRPAANCVSNSQPSRPPRTGTSVSASVGCSVCIYATPLAILRRMPSSKRSTGHRAQLIGKSAYIHCIAPQAASGNVLIFLPNSRLAILHAQVRQLACRYARPRQVTAAAKPPAAALRRDRHFRTCRIAEHPIAVSRVSSSHRTSLHAPSPVGWPAERRTCCLKSTSVHARRCPAD